MDDIKSCSFWSKLNSNFQKDIEKLIVQSRSVNFFKIIKGGCIVFLIATITYYRKDLVNNSVNIDALITLGMGAIFLTVIETGYKEPKKKYEKARETVRNKMIVKICNCKGYCTCKEDFNVYMKDRKINILSPKKL